MTDPGSAEAFVAGFEGAVGLPDVWVFDRTDRDFLELAERGPVSDDDRARADKLLDPASRAEMLARRAAVRRALALYLGREPESVRTVVFPGGKPAFVPEPGDRLTLSYSYGYSGEAFCLTIGTASSLGVDVERLRAVPRARSIATRWFTDAEAATLAEWEPGEEAQGFLRLWTGKEALAKRHAAGLRLMSRRGLDLGAPELNVLAELEAGRLAHFEPVTGYVGAVASTAPVEGVRILVDPVFDA